jgi:hypothetical protein
VLCENYRNQHDPNTRAEQKRKNRTTGNCGYQAAPQRGLLWRAVCALVLPSFLTTRRLATSPDVQPVTP